MVGRRPWLSPTRRAPSGSRWLQQVFSGELVVTRSLFSKDTFKMEEDIGLVVFEHLSHQFDIHILKVDFLDGCYSLVSNFRL